MEKIREQVQQAHQLSDQTLGKMAVAIGGGGSFLQSLTEWSNIFVAVGNALLVAGGLYLMSRKIFGRMRRTTDVDKRNK